MQGPSFHFLFLAPVIDAALKPRLGDDKLDQWQGMTIRLTVLSENKADLLKQFRTICFTLKTQL